MGEKGDDCDNDDDDKEEDDEHLQRLPHKDTPSSVVLNNILLFLVLDTRLPVAGRNFDGNAARSLRTGFVVLKKWVGGFIMKTLD